MAFRYYEFHAAPETDNISPKTHGIIPVWGFGTVVASSLPDIKPKERVYGFLAPTRFLLVPVNPADTTEGAFYVYRPHLPAGML